MKKFKDTLKGKRIILKRTIPTIDLAKTIFSVVDANRSHLAPWFPWEEFTLKEEDSMKYLLDKEEETEKGKKVEYGIYVNNEYVGNIGVFDISEKNKSVEIGYWLSSNFTRKGYMTEAVKIVEKEFFKHFKVNRIQIKCDDDNEASIGVAKKCNYVFEGKLRKDDYSKRFRKFRNTVIFSKLKSEFK
jgi:ribosomal-protein-serine acetyltransferase